MIKIPKEYKREVGITAEKSFDKAGELFVFQKSVEVIILPKISEIVIPEIGIGAITDHQGYIYISIDFSRRDIKKIIKEQLPLTIYHELSHIIRMHLFGNLVKNLLDNLIAEGIASYIEKEVFNKRISYIEPIQNEMRYWRKAQKILRKKKYNYEDRSGWFYGTKKLPRWIGYRLGYLLVDSFMQRQKNLSLAQLIRTKSSEVLRGAGDIYNPTLRLTRKHLKRKI